MAESRVDRFPGGRLADQFDIDELHE